ncbi:Alpha/Beta hydrolase protein [Lyophyllum atratum]|nr:Alpha/Beta hydrolase protein [Lyophyllum atratum]
MHFFLLAAQMLLGLVLTRADDLSADAISINDVSATVTFHHSSFTKDFTSSDGTKVHAQAIGNPRGPHVIFAHGLTCTMAAFDPLFEDKVLLATLYMVRYDTRGHGLSGKPLTPDFYTSDRYADDLKAVINGFKLHKPFFVGWSHAGTIAADIAANFPHPLPFSGLVWLAGLPYLGDILPVVALPTVLGFLPGLQDTEDAALALQTRIDLVETFSAKTNSVPYATKLGWVGSTAYLVSAVASLILGRSQDPTRLLEEGAAGWPVLILCGTADRHINGTALISNVAPKFKNVESHLIKGAGHILFYDDEPTVSRYLLSFIARIKATKPYP